MSLTNNLGKRSIQLGAQVHASNDYIDLDMGGPSLEAQLSRYNRIGTAIDSVTALSAMFHEQARKGVTKEQVRFYELSVESIFAAAGEPIPASELLVSFESAEDYSTEAEKKTSGRLKALINWLVSQFIALGSSIKNMVTSFHSLVTNRRTALVAMRDKAKTGGDKTADPRPKSDGEKVTVKAAGLLGDGGFESVVTLHTDAKAGAMTLASAIQSDVRIVKKHIDGALSKTGGFTEDGAVKELEAIFRELHATSAAGGYVKKYTLVKDLEIELTIKNKGWTGTTIGTTKSKPDGVTTVMPRLTQQQTVRAFELSLDLINNNPLGKALTDTSVAVADLLDQVKKKRDSALTDAADGSIDAPWFYRDLANFMSSLTIVVRDSSWLVLEVERVITRYAVASEYD